MKKVLYSMTLIIALTLAGTGCGDFIDVNDDPNNPLDVQEHLILPAAELTISRNMVSGFASTVIQNFLQNMAINQPNPQTGTYRMIPSEVDGDWSSVYTTGLNNLKLLNEKAEKNENFNYAGIAKILMAYTLGTATDLWGDIPYSEAFAGTDNFTPVYDSQEQIYDTIQQLLDNAIADIEKESAVLPGGDDLCFGGDMDKWKKLAYSLKARYYMHLTKAPGHAAAQQADLALTALENGMTSNEDAFLVTYPGAAGYENGWFFNFNDVSTAILASTFVDGLKDRDDPRLSLMVKPAEDTGEYEGRVIGTEVGVLTHYSYPTDFYAGIGASTFLFNYSEALFLKAEATLIKSGSSASQPFFQDAIRAHMELLEADPDDIDDYLADEGTLTTSNALEKIMIEKSVANFLNYETFTDWRRTGFPALTKVEGALSDIPRRLLYPENEMLSNAQPQQSAKLTDRVWWDTE